MGNSKEKDPLVQAVAAMRQDRINLLQKIAHLEEQNRCIKHVLNGLLDGKASHDVLKRYLNTL